MDEKKYIEGLRIFLRDFSEKNRILKFNVESDDISLSLFLNMALGMLNNLPPNVLQWGMGDFPIPALLIHQAVIEALVSASILQARNEITYNNGGISVKFQDGNRYQNVLQPLFRMIQLEMDALIKIKVNANIDAAWGGVSSPYSYIAGYPYLIRPYSGLGEM